MRLCDDVITVFNGRTDPETGETVYLPTVIRGVSWYGGRAGAADAGGGRTEARTAVVRIPEGADAGGKAWAEPAAWRRAADPSGLWTLQGGDVIVRGDASLAEPCPSSLKAEFDGCATVTKVTDNRRGRLGRHWKAEGA